MVVPAAADDEVGGRDGVGEAVRSDGGDGVGGGELRGPAAAGVDPQIGAAQPEQGRGDHPGVASGADQQRAASGHREVPAFDEVEADGGDRASGRAEIGLAADGLAGGQGRVEQPAQRRGRVRVGGGERVADLAEDLVLADDHRVQPGGHLQQVLDGQLAGMDLELPRQPGAIRRQRVRDRVEDRLDRPVEKGGIEVQLEPVARGEQDEAGDLGALVERLDRAFGRCRQNREFVQGREVVAEPYCGYRHAEHRNPGPPAPRTPMEVVAARRWNNHAERGIIMP